MADNKINVTVSANTRKNITVTSSQVSTEISASADLGRFWAEKAKNWAISDVIIDNIDYSSKHYANKAKESATNASNFENAIKQTYNAFLDSSVNANNELLATKEEVIADIQQEGIESSKLAQEWATSEVIVDNTDYSAKYYAEKAKDNSGIFYDELADENIDVDIISGEYATKSDLELGLDTKQDKGDYATRTELTDGLNTKQAKGNYALIEDIPTQVSELENDSNYATQTQVMQAIASIPQFSLSIVEALPETGAKMTLYLVPKEGTNNDVYDEYIWIEQTSSFEHLGTTAVDLTDYVKNTDYATENTTGVIRALSSYGLQVSKTTGVIYGQTKTLSGYNNSDSVCVISKGTLDNVLTQYSKTVVTTEADYEALETKDANTLYLIEE